MDWLRVRCSGYRRIPDDGTSSGAVELEKVRKRPKAICSTNFQIRFVGPPRPNKTQSLSIKMSGVTRALGDELKRFASRQDALTSRSALSFVFRQYSGKRQVFLVLVCIRRWVCRKNPAISSYICACSLLPAYSRGCPPSAHRGIPSALCTAKAHQSEMSAICRGIRHPVSVNRTIKAIVKTLSKRPVNNLGFTR